MRDRERRTRAAAAALVAVGLALPTTQASAEPVGFVAAVQGSAEIRAAAATVFEAAALDRDVEIGDVVRTGPDSAVKIILADDTILTVGDSTELELDSYVVGSAATREPSVLRLLKGRARTVVGERFGGPTRVEVHTPTAVVGVKGTAFDVYVLADAAPGLWTLVCNVEGAVFVRSTAQADPSGRSLSSEPQTGFCTQIFPDAGPEDEIPRPDWAPPVEGPPGELPSVRAQLAASAQAVEPAQARSRGTTGPGTAGQDRSGEGSYFEDVVQTETAMGGSLLEPSPFPGGNVAEPDPPGGGVVEPP